MSAENVVPFRRRPVEGLVWSDGRVQRECDELVHVFASVPGRCQCGRHLWEAPAHPPEAEADR